MSGQPLYTKGSISLISNGIAIGLSASLTLGYAHWKSTHRTADDDHDYHNLTWYDYLIGGVIAIFSAAFVYFVTYYLFGYLPMSHVSEGLFDRWPQRSI